MYIDFMQISPTDLESEYSLNELLSRMSSENPHEEVDFGEPVGKEVW